MVQGNKGQSLREREKKKKILGNREHKKIKSWGTGEQTKLFQGNRRIREQVPPYQGSVLPNRQILGGIRAKSDGSGESAHLHRLTLASPLYKISCAALNGDLCAIHASSEYSNESVHLRRHSHWTMRLVSRSIVLAA